jgi:alanine racemase
VDYLAVAFADEGAELREKGIKLPIMVMNSHEETFPILLAYQLEAELFSREMMTAFIGYLDDVNPLAPVHVHIKIDTGMHRLGFMPEEVPWIIEKTLKTKHISIKSAFTHLAAADENDKDGYSLQQLETFRLASAQLENGLGYKILKHALNSAGIARFPAWHFDMVRLGIGLYGIDPSHKQQNKLMNVTQLTTTISQIKVIKKGESVGYSRNWIASRDSEIATLAIGYADGLDRRFGNGAGHIALAGRLAPLVGNICMDMCFADVTGFGAKAGDIVTVFGRSPSLQQQAKAIGTIPYELLTNVGGRVKRVFFSE